MQGYWGPGEEPAAPAPSLGVVTDALNGAAEAVEQGSELLKPEQHELVRQLVKAGRRLLVAQTRPRDSS